MFGDLQESNIVDTPDENVQLIDFDWAGQEGVVTYPLAVLPAIKWAKGAGALELIPKEHDIEMVALAEANYSKRSHNWRHLGVFTTLRPLSNTLADAQGRDAVTRSQGRVHDLLMEGGQLTDVEGLKTTRGRGKFESVYRSSRIGSEDAIRSAKPRHELGNTFVPIGTAIDCNVF